MPSPRYPSSLAHRCLRAGRHSLQTFCEQRGDVKGDGCWRTCWGGLAAAFCELSSEVYTLPQPGRSPAFPDFERQRCSAPLRTAKPALRFRDCWHAANAPSSLRWPALREHVTKGSLIQMAASLEHTATNTDTKKNLSLAFYKLGVYFVNIFLHGVFQMRTFSK